VTTNILKRLLTMFEFPMFLMINCKTL